MDHAFAIEKLSSFIERASAFGSDLPYFEATQAMQYSAELFQLEGVARQIENAYKVGLGDYPRHDRKDWRTAVESAAEALGYATSADEIAAFKRPQPPAIAANTLHSWVWAPAAPLWAADAHRDAVLAAARTVNRRLQQKLERHDIGETDLCMQAFDIKPPAVGKPRLRFEGDPSTPTWRARQDGAKYLSAGAFLGIRNLAAHEETVTWSKQVALEYLATFSVIARWIEECSVEKAP
ncbi:TIGR02391 family protein [Streptomyces sp. CO7]